jgi:ATP-dependent DNA helicase RecQ
MGIDKADIRYVYHYNLPKSLENYSQEVGRAGRDDKPSICEMLACAEDLNTLENFVYGDTPSLNSVRDLVTQLFSQEGNELELSLYDLSARHDIRQLVTRTLLTYLELDGYLREGTPFYAEYRFRPLATHAEILARFQGERREFLRKVFAHAKKAKTWFDIDVDRAAQAIGAPRDRIVRALGYLGEQRLLELVTAGVRNRFHVLTRPEDREALVASLHARTLDRERRELARLNQVLELLSHDGCQVNQLCMHFGEPRLQPCGHCSWCSNGRQPAVLPARPRPHIDDAVWADAEQVRRQYPDLLADARAFARFLCGLTSPKLTKARLSSHSLFGVFGEVPFVELLQRAET